MLSLYGIPYAESYTVEGRINIINARASFIQVIQPPKNASSITVTIHHFESYTNGINRQIISPHNLKIFPEPQENKTSLDRYGNKISLLTFTTIPSIIKIESNFIFSAQADVFGLETHYPYPLEAFDVKHQNEFIEATTYCPLNKSSLINLAESLSEGLDKEYLVVMNTMKWVTNNIELVPETKHKDAFVTYEKRYGNKDAIINLIITLLRCNGIPARVVQGLSIDQVYNIGTSDMNTEIRYPKSHYKWIEVYFPDRDWVPFDPFYSYFIIPVNLIRRSIGKYSDEGLDRAYDARNRKLKITSEFYVEVRRQNSKFKFLDEYENGKYITILPSLHYEDLKYSTNILLQKPETKRSYYDRKRNFGLPPYSKEFDTDFIRCDVKVSQDVKFAQGFELTNDFTIKEISIPIFRFNNDPFGKIWLSIYSDKNGKPDEEIVKSTPINVDTLPVKENFFWCNFLFLDNNKQNYKLEHGKYWIVFNYDCDELILWYGIFSNPFGDIHDTLYITRDTYKWENSAYLDLCFMLRGK